MTDNAWNAMIFALMAAVVITVSSGRQDDHRFENYKVESDHPEVFSVDYLPVSGLIVFSLKKYDRIHVKGERADLISRYNTIIDRYDVSYEEKRDYVLGAILRNEKDWSKDNIYFTIRER